ncbi:hypothetical protein [Variovorax gossypii]|uniref:hypothetical protein n=1 Tax=Variovorax gossypii TaxID=1679495 RepID=UPI001F0B78FD|nr:hypothetical protein [Variovorax gossypii]
MTNPDIASYLYASTCCWVPLDTFTAEFIGENVAERKRRNPFGPVIPPQKNGDAGRERAKATNTQ